MYQDVPPCVGMLASDLAVVFAIQFPSNNVSGKAVAHGQNTWAPATHVGSQGGDSGSWLWLGPIPATVAIEE